MTSLAHNITDTWTFARRNAAHIRQIPEKLLDVTLQPIMFVALFAYVFGGVINIPGGSYREYLLPGILVQSLAFGCMMGPAMSICNDLAEGVVDRFRTLPIRRSSYLNGHLLSEFAASMLSVTIVALTGLAVGWRIHTDVLHAAAGFGIYALFAFTMLWIGTLVGITVRSSDAAQGLAFVTVFPLTFVANTFVPLDGLPIVLQKIALYNPFSVITAAGRDLWGNPSAPLDNAPWVLAHPVAGSLVWCGALLAVIVPLTLWRFRARTAD